jgi:hypothetical protein
MSLSHDLQKSSDASKKQQKRNRRSAALQSGIDIFSNRYNSDLIARYDLLNDLFFVVPTRVGQYGKEKAGSDWIIPGSSSPEYCFYFLIVYN